MVTSAANHLYLTEFFYIFHKLKLLASFLLVLGVELRMTKDLVRVAATSLQSTISKQHHCMSLAAAD